MKLLFVVLLSAVVCLIAADEETKVKVEPSIDAANQADGADGGDEERWLGFPHPVVSPLGPHPFIPGGYPHVPSPLGGYPHVPSPLGGYPHVPSPLGGYPHVPSSVGTYPLVAPPIAPGIGAGYPLHTGVQLLSSCPPYCTTRATQCWSVCSSLFTSSQCHSCMVSSQAVGHQLNMYNGCSLCFPGGSTYLGGR